MHLMFARDNRKIVGEAVIATVALLSLGVGPARADVCTPKILSLSNFNTGLQGWTSNTPAQIKWVSTGTNSGYVQFTDQTGDSTYIDAPASFHGAYTTLNNAGYLSYTHRIFSETGVTAYSPYEVRMSGPGGAATFNGATPTAATSGWVTVLAPIVAGDWQVTSGTWSGLLANVTDVQIDIELVTNQTIPGDTDIEGIDTIALVMLPCPS
jgi:hypothetical protein